MRQDAAAASAATAAEKARLDHGLSIRSSASDITNSTSVRHKRDPFRDMPVEKLDVSTGTVLQRFDTAEQAHASVSTSGLAQFGNFKKVLQGKGHFTHHIYKVCC